MTDIVERLRTRMITVARGDGQYDDIPDEDCWEAADEIEQLRRENGQIKRELWSKRDALRIARGLPLEGEP